MRVLIIARGYPTDDYPLNGVFEYDQGKALVKQGHEVIYGAIDLRSLRRKRRFGKHTFERDGLLIESINLPLGRIPNYLLDKARMLAVKKIHRLAEEKYGEIDVVHSHFIWFNHATVQALKNKKACHIATEHYSEMNNETLTPYYYNLGAATYQSADQLIAVSRYLAGNLNKHFGRESLVVPNIVDTSCFISLDAKKEKGCFRFVTVGRLEKLKHTDKLIESFAAYFGEDENTELVIIGDGSQKEALTELIKQKNLDKRVLIPGQKTRGEINEIFGESDAFVSASPLESFGLAYLEALASGLPVICPSKGGPEDFVHGENGLRPKSNDPESLGKAMVLMKNNIKKYNRRKISEEMKTRYAPETIAKTLENIYIARKNDNEKQS